MASLLFIIQTVPFSLSALLDKRHNVRENEKCQKNILPLLSYLNFSSINLPLLLGNICFAVIISTVIWLKPDSNQISDKMKLINELGSDSIQKKDVIDQIIHESFFAQINQFFW